MTQHRIRAGKRKKLGDTRHVLTHETLRESLRAHGQFTPVFVLGGIIVDGRRRDQFLRELGRTPNVVKLRDHTDAARILWQLHPWQALQEYCDGLSLQECAALLATTPADVATVRRHVMPAKSTSSFGEWRPNYKGRWDAAQRYLAKVRQGTCQLTLSGIEGALRLPPFGFRDAPK